MRTLHARRVHPRRVEMLRHHLAPLVPEGASVLDVGCGDGWLSHRLIESRPDASVEGIDVATRTDAHIPVRVFDGHRIPFGDRSRDVVLLVDVLHHARDPLALLREATRVARRALLIKDHIQRGWVSRMTLRGMDWFGNAQHGVACPGTYWTRDAWDDAIRDLDLTVERWISRLRLYPLPWDWIFGGSLHFIARLGVPGTP